MRVFGETDRELNRLEEVATKQFGALFKYERDALAVVRALSERTETSLRKQREAETIREFGLCGSLAENGQQCTLPAGHNMGKADVPSNHRSFLT